MFRPGSTNAVRTTDSGSKSVRQATTGAAQYRRLVRLLAKRYINAFGRDASILPHAMLPVSLRLAAHDEQVAMIEVDRKDAAPVVFRP